MGGVNGSMELMLRMGSTAETGGETHVSQQLDSPVAPLVRQSDRQGDPEGIFPKMSLRDP